MKEIWKDIKSYEENYQVSNLSRIKSLDVTYEVKLHNVNEVTKKGKILKQNLKSNGYLYVTLYKGKRHRTVTVHRLVAEAFIPNPNNYKEVNHINGIKTDNRIENLEWCTRSENMKHAYKMELKTSPNKGKFDENNPKSKKIVMKDLETNQVIKVFNSMNGAMRYLNVKSCGGICNAVKGRKPSAYGYRWEYYQ